MLCHQVHRLRPLVLALAVLVALGAALAVPAPATATGAVPGRAMASLPTAAVALGDSFVSGEGAGDYLPVVDLDGVPQDFPGWDAANSNAYFCHRSANASLYQADLPGVQARFNLACSGGKPQDFGNASIARPKGRTVAAQLDQLRSVGQTHDIDLVLVGLGSNNSSFTFGNVATMCANRFIADAWVGWWEFWAYLDGPVKQAPCTADELATADQFAAATAETTAAVRDLLTTLAAIDADGQHRVVFQDYTNPLPLDLQSKFHSEDGRKDDRDKFRALGAERYAGGCPIHRASLAAGHIFSRGLGTMVESVHATMSAEFPGRDLVYLNVQDAFTGARLCETASSPADSLATPTRLMDGPSGTFVTSLSGRDKIAVERIANTCVEYFQTCQESWHPNAEGHAVLGRCLAGAAATAGRALTCWRAGDGTIITE